MGCVPTCESGPPSYNVTDDPEADGALSERYVPSAGGWSGDAQFPIPGQGSSKGRLGEAGSPDMLTGVYG